MPISSHVAPSLLLTGQIDHVTPKIIRDARDQVTPEIDHVMPKIDHVMPEIDHVTPDVDSGAASVARDREWRSGRPARASVAASPPFIYEAFWRL